MLPVLWLIYLFSDKDGEVPVFLVDFCAERDEAQEVDPESHAVNNKLPVPEMVQKRTGVVKQLNDKIKKSEK